MKLTLRELFLLVALVAMGFAWWVDRGQLRRKAAESDRWKAKTETLVEYWRREGGTIEFDDSESPEDGFSVTSTSPCDSPQGANPFE